MEKVFRMRSINFVSIFAFETIPVDGVDIKMISFELIIFFIVIDFIGNKLFAVVAALID